MKSKNSKAKQKERDQLIFKYLKSVTPYNPNPQTEYYLNRLRGKTLKIKQPEMLINSRVYNISVATVTKNKKRVTFAEPQAANITKGAESKNSKNKGSVLAKQQMASPLQIQNDLASLQNSVFSIFKIKPDQQRLSRQTHNSNQFNLGTKYNKSSQSNLNSYQNTSRMLSNTSNYQFNEPQSQRTYSASTFSRPNIYSNIKPKTFQYQRNLQSKQKEISQSVYQKQVNYSKSQAKFKTAHINPNQASSRQTSTMHKNQKNQIPNLSKIQTVSSDMMSGLSRHQSDNKNVSSSSRLQRQYSNRSSIYSQQSHNLMVQIFKNKLKNKIG